MPGVNILVQRDDPDTDLLTYTTIRLYRSSAIDGTYSYISVSAALVSGTFDYTLNDPSGTNRHFYRYLLYNATGPVLSDLSPVILPPALTMRDLRIEAAQQAGEGFRSTCTADGGVGYLEDARLLDSGVDEDFLRGSWIYRPDAADSGDLVRRIAVESGFDASAGRLTPSRAWANAPEEDEEYHIFGLFPPMDAPGAPYSWDRAIRDGLGDVWFVDQLSIAVGDGTSRRFDLTEHIAYVGRDQCRRVLLRETVNGEDVDTDASTNGMFWSVIEDLGSLTLELSVAPTSSQTVILEVNRQDAGLYIDSDATIVREDVAVAATVRAAYRRLNEVLRPGKYAAELAGANAAFWRVYRPPTVIVKGL